MIFFYICQFRVLYNGTQYKEINLDVNDLVCVKKEKTHFLHSLLILQQLSHNKALLIKEHQINLISYTGLYNQKIVQFLHVS